MKKKLTGLLLALAVLLGGCQPLQGGTQEPLASQGAAPEVQASAQTDREETPADQADQEAQGSQTSGLTVHFIDVGQADAALVECGGQAMLIDGGNAADSSLVVSYLKGQGVEYLDYVVCSHAHEDHVGGLSGPLNACTVGAVLAPVTQYDSKVFSDFVKYTQQQGLTVTVPRAGDTFSLGDARVTVLGPVAEYEQTNNTSLVLRLDYGQTSFLFTGDMEREAEEGLVASGSDLSATVLKVGHHGSNTSSSYVFLRAVLPAYAVISVGADNSYGHPHQEVLSRLYDAQTTVYRTDQQGTVVAVSDGAQVTFTTEKAVPPTPGRGQEEETVYIGNLRSHVFHRDTCASLPAEKNQVLFESRDQAVEEGYTPCGQCQP
jgi:competence protein ComEC